jgi:hypothetical protein
VLARSSAVTRSVATQAGTMQFTRTPSISPTAEVKRMSPAFAAPYSGDQCGPAGDVHHDFWRDGEYPGRRLLCLVNSK